jgi:hypothetical protein
MPSTFDALHPIGKGLAWVKVFWFFFSKKNRLRAGLVEWAHKRERKRFFLKKEAKTSIRLGSERRNLILPIAQAGL